MSQRQVVYKLTLTVLLSASNTVLPRFATNELESAVLSFPEIRAQKYRPDLAVRSANLLIAAGKDAAIATLDSVVKLRPASIPSDQLEHYEQISEKVCH